MRTLHETATTMLALINPAALPALRFAATFFLLINLAGGTYIFATVTDSLIATGTSTMTSRQLVT